MGVKYAEGVILDVEGMWKESKIRVPMICLLSMGSDPTMTIDGLAKKHQIGKLSTAKKRIYSSFNLTTRGYLIVIECHTISMGQGQEVHARRLLQLCQNEVTSRV